ncbi:MAG: MBOAT family protein, partial [Desulfovibrio sp.]|nr:MBOAT family protein [Desulfovibrio sp.]
WGALHGLMLSINHFFRACIKDSPLQALFARLPFRLFFIMVTFLCLTLCWVVFRAQSMDGALRFYEALFLSPFVSLGLDNTVQGAFAHNYFQGWLHFALVFVSAFIVWGLPCSHEIFSRRPDAPKRWLRFKLSASWAFVLSLLFVTSLLFLTRQSAFLYFQF